MGEDYLVPSVYKLISVAQNGHGENTEAILETEHVDSLISRDVDTEAQDGPAVNGQWLAWSTF